MDRIASILKEELSAYASVGLGGVAYPLFDDQNQTYGINVVSLPRRDERPDIVIFARIVDQKIIIEDDTTDKPLVEALLARGVACDENPFLLSPR